MAVVGATFAIAIIYANSRYSRLTPKERDQARDDARWW